MTHHLNNFSEASNELKLIRPTDHSGSRSRATCALPVRRVETRRAETRRARSSRSHIAWTIVGGRDRVGIEVQNLEILDNSPSIRWKKNRVGRETREPRGDEGDDARGEG